MNIQVLGAHNCEAQGYKLGSLLIDGVLALDAGGLTSSLSLSAQRKLKAILLTHRHYDHIRDIPALAMNFFLDENTIIVYSIPSVHEALVTHLMNDRLYPNLLERPPGKPTIQFSVMEPGKSRQIEGYGIMAVEVKHSCPAVGYQVTSPDGKAVFYTGDTGPGLADCWEYVSPHLLIIELTTPDRYEDFAWEKGHLTPKLLKEELIGFRKLKGYLPRVVTVHMNPRLEQEIAGEIADVARALGISIDLAYEGMQLAL